MDFLIGDEYGPRLANLAEHLFGLEELATVEEALADGLRGDTGGIYDLLDATDVGDGDQRGAVVGAALQLDLADAVGFLAQIENKKS